MKRNVLSLILLPLAALAGCGIRYWNLTAGVDAQGLPISHHPSAYVLAAWGILCFLLFAALAATSQGRSGKSAVLHTHGALTVIAYFGAVMFFFSVIADFTAALVDGPGWVAKQLELSAAAGDPPEKVARILVETARARAEQTGRPDDITAAVLRLEPCGH